MLTLNSLSGFSTGRAAAALPPPPVLEFVVFDIPGSYTWTVPAGVFTIEEEAIGGGCGGSSAAGSGAWGGNGGAGARRVRSVVPGQVISLVVGAGSAGGTTWNLAAAPGEASSVDGTLIAPGGAVGNSGSLPVTGSGGDVNGSGGYTRGHNGTPGDAVLLGGGAGAGGPGDSGIHRHTNGAGGGGDGGGYHQAGNAPGGGGAGRDNAPGYPGAPGRVKFSWGSAIGG